MNSYRKSELLKLALAVMAAGILMICFWSEWSPDDQKAFNDIPSEAEVYVSTGVNIRHFIRDMDEPKLNAEVMATELASLEVRYVPNTSK